MKPSRRCIFFLIALFFYGVEALWCCEKDDFEEITTLFPASFDFTNLLNGHFDNAWSINDCFLGGHLASDNDKGGVSSPDGEDVTLGVQAYSLQEESEESASENEEMVCFDSAGCEQDDTEVKVKCPRRRDPAYVRESALMRALQKKKLCFDDVRYGDYAFVRRETFQADILNLMHRNADIYEEDGYYRCRGMLQETPKPSKSVAIAMFELSHVKPTLFQLKFQLYSQGYREYTPEALGHIDTALVVGDVYPVDHTFVQEDSAFCKNAKEVWDTVKEFTEDKLQAYLKHPPVKHAACLSDRRLRRVVQILWGLKKEGSLDYMKILKSSKDASAFGYAQQNLGAAHIHKKSTRPSIFGILLEKKNQDLPITDFAPVISDARGPLTHHQKTKLLQMMLTLVVGGVAISYDKDAQTVKLLDQEIPVAVPTKNTNLLTMTYDLVQKYKNNLEPSELMYYAYRGGYWPQGFQCEQGRLFLERTRKYKMFLAIQGYTDVWCCSSENLLNIERQRRIWCFAKHEDVARDLDYYRSVIPSALQTDIDVIKELHDRRKSKEFIVFFKHLKGLDIASQENASVAKRYGHAGGEAGGYGRKSSTEKTDLLVDSLVGSLRKSPLSLMNFWNICASFGVQTVAEMWDIAGALTCNAKGGRLLYNPQSGMFFLSAAGGPSQPAESMLPAAVFSLKKKDPYMPTLTIVHMLKQQGFQGVNVDAVHDVLHGLAVLDLYPQYEGVLTHERDIIERAFNEEGPLVPDLGADGVVAKYWEIGIKVACWIRDGSFANLLEAYLDVNKVAPSAKRPKLETQTGFLEDIIGSKTPIPADLFQMKGLKKGEHSKFKVNDVQPHACVRKLSERAQKLLKVLEETPVCFKDVKGSIYKGFDRYVFQLNILQIMNHGRDIREEKGKYAHYGVANTTPHESVAVAMFRLLNQSPPLSAFQLKFKLYALGHRSYAPEALGNVELALAVGGVHPHGDAIMLRKAAFCEEAKKLWREMQHFSQEKFEKFMKSPPQEYAKILQGRNKRVIQHLWDFHDRWDLDTIKDLQADTPIAAFQCLGKS